jgi:integrase
VAGRRRFGAVRRLPSGRWQASYQAPDGSRRTAPATFATKTDADRWVSAVETDMLRGTWVDDAAAKVPFGVYAKDWLASHPRIGPRWRETCERNLRLHLAPLQQLALRDLSPSVVRHWYAEAMAGDGGRTSIAQSYRFLRAVLNSAVADSALARNPCQIRGAGIDRAVERPVATPAELAALIEAIAPRYRAAVVLAGWCGLRRGEVLALTRGDLDLDRGLVTVRRTRTELLSTADRFDAPPKTDAGYRTVAIPPHVMPLLAEHMETFAGPERVFVGRSGEPMRGDALRLAFQRARAEVGLPQLRFHDLRHTGQTLAAETGASLADLMRRLGHSSMVAAKRYLHATDSRDRQIADALSQLAAETPAARDRPRTITQR